MSVTLGNSAVNGSGTLEIQVAAANAATIAANSQINFAVALPVLSGGTGVTTKTGTGAVVLGTSPTLTTPTITTPTFDSAQLPTVVGTAPLYMCRAWVRYNAAGTMFASGNVSSVTHGGTGNYTVNFTTAMPDVNYSCSMMVGAQSFDPTAWTNTISVGSLNVLTGYWPTGTSWNYNDNASVAIAIFR